MATFAGASMTDGGITDQTRPRDPTSSEKPHISNSSTRQTIVSKTNATAYFKSLCDVMKTQSIYVYTVGYQITSGSSEDTLMIGRGRGKIVNICSVQTALARPGIAPYTMTKGAVANLTKGMMPTAKRPS